MIPKTIKTNIKFYSGLDDVEKRLYGFVTKVNGSWRGCRETELQKKIVFVDPSLIDKVIPNVLYSCTLIPMRNDNGFIVKSINLLQFEASISTYCRENKHQFSVTVKFGNKVFVYDPSSKEHRKRDITKIADILRNRADLLNAHSVAEEFINNACIVKRLYNQYQQNVSRKNDKQ